MPDIAATVAEQIEILRRIAGRQCGQAHPARTRLDHPAHRRRLARGSTCAEPTSWASRRRTPKEIIRMHIEDGRGRRVAV